MIEQAQFSLRGRNPDVLTCIANLSNDEVFTPPEFANRMLDTLAEAWASSHDGASIWEDRTVTFLDPCTKSGVFLREITNRLNKGLEKEIPDLQERVDHILTNQVFGIGITRITSLLARRSLYCSRHANGSHSIAKSFDNEAGNVWFERMEHTWEGSKCKFCGAGKDTFDRGEELESHAYAFIHTDNIKARIAELFGDTMQFDVIIGNPPYQLSDGGFGTSAAPIYHLFVEQAKKLEPHYLSLVIPARWFSGGKGLDEFRSKMLEDDRIRIIEDFPDSNDVFPGTQIKGGICYFLWTRDHRGLCRVRMHDKNKVGAPMNRPLLESGTDIFIRFNEGLSILKKVIDTEQHSKTTVLSLPAIKRFDRLVSSRKPFGLETTFKGKAVKHAGDVLVYQNGGIGYTPRNAITVGVEIIGEWKVFIPYVGSGSDAFPHPILGKPFVGGPESISSETYMYIGPFASETEAANVVSYIRTKLFRFLVLLHKPSQHATRKVYTFVPTQDWTKRWADADLYEKYSLTDEEIAFIESMIRPMENDNNGNDD